MQPRTGPCEPSPMNDDFPILAAVAANPTHPYALLEHLQALGLHVSRSTLYRRVEALAAQGWLDADDIRGESGHYRRACAGHGRLRQWRCGRHGRLVAQRARDALRRRCGACRFAGLLAANADIRWRGIRTVRFSRLFTLREVDICGDLDAYISLSDDGREYVFYALDGAPLDFSNMLDLCRIEADLHQLALQLG